MTHSLIEIIKEGKNSESRTIQLIEINENTINELFSLFYNAKYNQIIRKNTNIQKNVIYPLYHHIIRNKDLKKTLFRKADYDKDNSYYKLPFLQFYLLNSNQEELYLDLNDPLDTIFNICNSMASNSIDNDFWDIDFEIIGEFLSEYIKNKITDSIENDEYNVEFFRPWVIGLLNKEDTIHLFQDNKFNIIFFLINQALKQKEVKSENYEIIQKMLLDGYYFSKKIDSYALKYIKQSIFKIIKSQNLMELVIIVKMELHKYLDDSDYKSLSKETLENILIALLSSSENFFEIDEYYLKDFEIINNLITHDKEMGFNSFSKEKFIQYFEFLNNFYHTRSYEPYRNPYDALYRWCKEIGRSTLFKRVIKEILETNDPKSIMKINLFHLLDLLSQQDLYQLLENQQLGLLRKIVLSYKKIGYEYYGFGDRIDKEIFEYFQTTLPHPEAEALNHLQNLISEQLIFDYGYHEEVKNAYKIYNNHVVKLWLPDTKVSYVPDSIGNLTFLKELNLSYCSVKTLPESFGNLTHLRKLDLRSCNLTHLPKSFGKLQKLRELCIRGNYFNSSPKILLKLKTLKYFDVYAEDLIEFPPFRKK